METKTCSTCKRTLPFEDFHKAKRGKFGLTHVCRSCQKAYADAWYRRNHPPKPVPPDGYKQCSKCKIEKPVIEFGNACKTWDKLRCECKSCSREARRKWGLKYGKRHREALKAEVLAAYGNKCACCGIEHPAFLTIDHINNDGAEHRKKYRLSTGKDTYGWLKRNNFPPGFQVLCANCNHGKNLNKGICPHKES